jgi:hypothetical protein
VGGFLKFQSTFSRSAAAFLLEEAYQTIARAKNVAFVARDRLRGASLEK